jgi:toxin YoeB
VKLVVSETAWDDYLHWQTQDTKLLKRLNELIRECSRTPFTGTGKPEPLRGPLSGWGRGASISNAGWCTA